jgi:hypothetical protein
MVINITAVWVFICWLLTCVACATPQAVQGDTGPPCPEHPVVKVGTGQGVIFPAGRGFVGGYKHGVITEYWTPSEAEVIQAEVGLATYLTQVAPTLAGKYASYTRQYAGFVFEGHRRIFMNFLCWPATSPGWRCASVGVDDGGDCYFQLEYDVTTGEYSHLSVNGLA